MLVRELLFKLGFDSVTAEQKAKRMDRVVNGLKRNLWRMAAAAGAASLALTVGGLRAADQYQNMANKLKLVTNGTEELKAAQEGVYEIAQRSRQALGATNDLYFGMSMAAERYGLSQERILRITETTAKLATVGGSDPASTAAALFQLRQGIMSGTLRGQELNSVLEQATPVAQAIVDGMRANGVNISLDNLRDMAAKGMVTGIQVLNALESQSAAADEKFSKLEKTGGQAWTQFKNSILKNVGEISKEEGTMQGVVEVFERLREVIESSAFKDAFITFSSLLAGILRLLTELVNVIVHFVSVIKEAVDALGGLERAFRLLISSMAAAAAFLMGPKLISALGLWLWYMGGLTVNAYAAAGGFWALAASMMAAAAPFLGVAAGIALVALGIEDLWTWIQGGESVLGRVLGSFEDFWLGVTNIFGSLGEMFKNWVDDFMSFFEPILEVFDQVQDGFNSIMKSKSNPFNWFSSQGEVAGQHVARSMAPVRNSQSIVFQPKVDISVPPGTQREQLDFMESRFRLVLDDYYHTQLRAAQNNYPEVE